MERLVHAWRIEEREYRRQESRRGRRHAYERLVPERTALIVVDMVPFFGEDNPYVAGIVPNIARLAYAVRKAGGAVVWVLPKAGPPSDAMVEFYGAKQAAVFAGSGGSGPLRDRLWPEFEVDEAVDLIVEKSASSAFFPGRSPVPQLLEERGIDSVLITGTVTNVCCEASARDASTLGFRVVMVADANAARRDEDHNATLYTIYRTFGDVRTTDEVIELVTA
ncbi:isochorismatase family cysteine hydrolase [Paractinoplanes durhamensis]|uniref:Hydrolase n=1 Tax=Paractinoplanes durhamensis TaxID=113563 RepID=A0ABQ3YQK1_9ACTN|nr:isochorismatase family cysteine hydrolase [Actinoplanes durhamensis]GID99814.1 hydrolase [Actinoplanes durhamensis]